MRFIGVDTETELFELAGTSKVNLRRPTPPLVCTVWWDDDGCGLIMHDDSSAHHQLFSNNDPDVIYAFHGVEFDLRVLCAAFPDLEPRLKELVREGRVWDTRVMYRLRDPDPQTNVFTLKNLARLILKEDMEKGDVRTSFRRGMALNLQQKDYAIQDARVTYQLATKLWEMPYGSVTHGKGPEFHVACRLNPDRELPDRLFGRAAANMTWTLGGHPLQVDVEELETLHNQLTLDVDRRVKQLRMHGLSRAVHVPGAPIERIDGYDINAGRAWTFCASLDRMVRRTGNARDGYHLEATDAKYVIRKQVLRGHFEEWAEENGIDPPRTEKTGEVTLARDDWKDYYQELPNACQAYLDYEKAKVFLARYTTPLIEAGATQVVPTYWIPGAATLRWAATKPPIQQWPPVARPIIKPRSGHRFIYADYPSLELYTLAHSMKMMDIEGPLMEALRSGEDVHSWAASRMYGKEIGEVTKEERQHAKVGNFGWPGGMGAKTMLYNARAQGLDWDLDDAKANKEIWFGAFPDVRMFLSQLNVDPWRFCEGDKRAWLRSLGFGDDWPSRFELSRALNHGRIYTVTTPMGIVIPERGYSMAANSFFQSPGACVITAAFNMAAEHNLPVCAVIHDMLMLESEKINLEQDAETLIWCMEEALARVCPSVPVPTIEYEILERWK